VQPKGTSKDRTEFAEAVSLNMYIHLALEGDAFLGLSKLVGPSTEFSPHQSEPPINNPHQHCQKGEGTHLHTIDNKRKA
jgi:hypothetical protein